ncbi:MULTISPECIES: helix-turn-helix domain-containing protein [unclassified Halomonas]|nr:MULTISPECIES: helix-turn-helix domain-containing protein [unclassified Halomonas]
MGLLSHLVDLENRVRVAESRGELRPLSSVGQVINEARTRQKLTVEALADLAGVGTVTIHKVEKGSLQVQVPKLVQIAEALGLELLVSAR